MPLAFNVSLFCSRESGRLVVVVALVVVLVGPHDDLVLTRILPERDF